MFTSAYRGVTRHRLTGRYESHFWDSSYLRPNVVRKMMGAWLVGSVSNGARHGEQMGCHVRSQPLMSPRLHLYPHNQLPACRRRAGAPRGGRCTWAGELRPAHEAHE